MAKSGQENGQIGTPGVTQSGVLLGEVHISSCCTRRMTNSTIVRLGRKENKEI